MPVVSIWTQAEAGMCPAGRGVHTAQQSSSLPWSCAHPRVWTGQASGNLHCCTNLAYAQSLPTSEEALKFHWYDVCNASNDHPSTHPLLRPWENRLTRKSALWKCHTR